VFSLGRGRSLPLSHREKGKPFLSSSVKGEGSRREWEGGVILTFSESLKFPRRGDIDCNCDRCEMREWGRGGNGYFLPGWGRRRNDTRISKGKKGFEFLWAEAKRGELFPD